MTARLSEFLTAQRASILELFTRRMHDGAVDFALSESQLRDRLPELLTELVRALEAAGSPSGDGLAPSEAAQAHGAQRQRVRYDPQAIVREFGVLRDCIFERLEQLQVTPTLRELRVLSDSLSRAAAESVARFVEASQRDTEFERRHLLELFEQAPGFVCFLRGPSQVFELANTAYFQLVGHRDILGKSAREALPELEGQGFFELLDRVFTSGDPYVGRSQRVELQRAPGAPLSAAFVDFVYQPIRGTDGAVLGILAQGHDVTELKRQETQRQAAETALRASEERYRTLFGSIDDGFCLLQLLFDDAGEPVDYRFLETNRAFERHTGLQGAKGKTARELVPELDPSWFRLYGRVATTGEAVRFENQAAAMGRWFEVYASRVGDAALRQVALVFKDVTDRKRIEKEREALLARESAARRQAEEASRLKDEFLATVSHELRTPLNAMLGWAHLLRVGTLTPPKRTRALEAIERNARAQAQLIEDLLDVSRILAGKLRLQVVPVELPSVVEAALDTVRPAAEAKEIQLQVAVDGGAAVMGDPHRLQQVVWNLLSNAVKFTPKGGRVTAYIQQRDASVDLTVVDTGRGIAKEFQPHVFERFRQEDAGSTRAHGGLGLGLSIVRQLVELHGGTVGVVSEGEGKGTSFTVSLPIAKAGRRTATQATPPQPGDAADESRCPPELDGLRVLVVDDEEDAREMVRTALETCGARVRVVGSAVEAWQHFTEQPPAVLISDIGMPEQDGYALIGKVRGLSRAAGGETPAIALTAYARTEDRTRALLSGFNSHVPKPVEPFELLAVVASLSGRTRRS